MHRFHILRFPQLGRAPRLLLALGVLAVVVAAGGAKATPAKAATYGVIEITFDNVSFERLNDGNLKPGQVRERADVYGVIGFLTPGPGIHREERLIGTWNNTAGCNNQAAPPNRTYLTWSANGIQCTKEVFQSSSFVYGFADVPMCRTDPFALPNHVCLPLYTYVRNNNTLTMSVQAGQTLVPYVTLYDADPSSSSDPVCVISLNLPITEASLVPGAAGNYVMAQGYNGYGSCTVRFRLRTLQ
jgi:hypothetical protein